MVKSKKGDRRERELVRLFSGEHDDSPFAYGEWAVMRAPSSGAATERELPDVLAGNGTKSYAVEAKSSGGDPIYLSAEEVGALEFFATNFGSTPVIGTRFDAKHGDPWYANDDDSGWRFFDPEKLHHSPSGSVRVKKEDLEHGATLEDLWNATQ